MNNKHDKILFWGCFIALITTSYAFISRMILCGGQFVTDFGLDKVSVGELQGAGIWPFGVSIILFSLFIDKIGYKVAMIFSFASYLIYTALAIAAYSAIHGVTGDALVAAQAKGVKLLMWGSIILGLGNGSVEAYINPVVATLFSKDKVKWLNILHAGWPAGLVLGGLCTIGLAANPDWRITLGLILVPAIIFFAMLIGLTFPKSEREQAGVSYVGMLKELGAFGAFVGFGLVFAQLGQVFGWSQTVSWILTGAVTLTFAAVTKSFGRGILVFLIIIMMPLATTEIGTDGWISSLMEEPMKAAGHHPGWVLVYTSAIMMVLRFFAGAIVHKISPLGLLASCAALAVLGLTWLSKTNGAGMGVIFAAATLYAVGKTFFWPTMLGVTSEQCPKGGALTLNAMGGIGMLAVGILGFPFIGYLQETTATAKLQAGDSAIYQSVTVEKKYLLGAYQAIDPVKSAAVTDEASHDELRTPGGREMLLKVRSMVGLIPLFAVETLDPWLLEKVPEFTARMEWFLTNRPELARLVSRWKERGECERHLLSLLRGHRMKCLLRRMLDETEFLSDYGVRALSKVHEREPYRLQCSGMTHEVAYWPGESMSGLFGGNSNWRGPIWMPVNFLIIESLQKFHHYYGDDFKVECPTGSGTLLTLNEIADELSRRLSKLFLKGDDGRRPVLKYHSKLAADPHFKDYVLFHEYFHGDTGRGVGASHQTGWTGLVAKLLQPRRASTSPEDTIRITRSTRTKREEVERGMNSALRS